MMDELHLPDPAVILKVAAMEQAIRDRKFSEAYRLSDELLAAMPLQFRRPRPIEPDSGPGEAA